MRHFQRLDGPALLGEGSVGPLRLALPGILYARTPDHAGPIPDDGPTLSALPAPGPMLRSLRLESAGQRLDLRLPVLTPEVAGPVGSGELAAERVLVVETPVPSAARERLGVEPFDLVVWGNARRAWSDPARFSREAVELRMAAGPGPALWAPGVATPGRLALLHYLGLDLLDSTAGLQRAVEGDWGFPEGEGYLPEGEEVGTPEARLRHVEAAYRDEEQRVRRHLRGGRLRELVEGRLVGEPRRAEVLRYLDEGGSAFLEEHAPVRGSQVVPYSTSEALRRPEVVRFREAFLHRYRPPRLPGLVLVPCSKTKPYANSPTHRRFQRALDAAPSAYLWHVVSVTSPLGLVPRELENFYPCRQYDIPVTGKWDEDERRFVTRAVERLRSQGGYRACLVHLPSAEYAWLEGALSPGPGVRWTVEEDSTTSPASLRKLTEAARELRPTGERFAGPMVALKDRLRALAEMQYPGELAQALFAPEHRLGGRPWFQRIGPSGAGEWATWREDVGLWRLTVAGASQLLPLCGGLRVEVRPGVELQGDLFAPGVHGGDPEIRVGDDVVLVRQGELVGVGEARVPGSWMGKVPRGLVVKVRHRVHARTPGPTARPP